jgi:hypothetical protein
MRTDGLDRRAFLALAGRRGVGLGLAATSLPAILAACGSDDEDGSGAAAAGSPSASRQGVAGTAIVGDVLDFALASSDWQGAFGWVRLRLHPAIVDGEEAWYVRTDASDEAYARREGLVFVPKISGLAAAGAAGEAFVFTNGAEDQPTVLSSEPGREDYSPAWRINEVTWSGPPTLLGSAAEVREAAEAGDLTLATKDVIANMPVAQWSSGAMPVDSELAEYLGGGQLIEAPDTSGRSILFKLHECFPASRYIVCDTSAPPMAEGMQISGSPGLAGATDGGATGRVNVFMGGIEGSGPMGGQPSVFDSSAGDPAWSPYWDHMTYVWAEEAEPRVLATESQIYDARDAGELDEFPGTPDTGGETFTVNCPVPVVAPNTFAA